MNNTKEILDDMRKITMLTGEISSVHEESLKNWPYIVFDDVSGVEIKYDLTKDRTNEAGEGYVEFRVESELDQSPIGTRCNNLADWVRDMFWNEIKVVVTLNGTTVHTNSSIGKNIGKDNGSKQD